MDLKDLKTVEDFRELFKKEPIPLYDDSPSYEEQNRPQLNDNLTEKEIEEALFWNQYRKGVMLVSGPPGAGKSLYAYTLAWKMKRLFKNCVVILDKPPRRLFGFYIPFTLSMLIEQIERLNEVAGFQEQDIENSGVDFGQRQWRSSRGDVFIVNAVMVLEEFHNYMDRRTRPPAGTTLGDIFKIWRHLNLLTIAVTTQKADLDYKRFQKAVTSEVRCSWGKELHNGRRSSTIAKIQPLQFVDSSGGILQARGKMVKRRIDGAEPRDALDGHTYFELFNSTNAQQVKITKGLRKAVR